MTDTQQPRGLVILRCGRQSLHPAWRVGAAAADWDLQLCPYEAGAGDDAAVRPGQKWDGLHAQLLTDQSWRRYDYIWLPDDDLATTAETVAALFAWCRRFDAAIAAPALSEDSPWSLAMTLRNHSFSARATTYVEVMAPCFRRDVLEQLLPTFTLSLHGAGWGLDMLWAHRLAYRGLYIFDDLPVQHTRPVGAQRDAQMAQDLNRSLWRLLARHRVRPYLRTLRGYDANGVVQEANPGSFLLRYLQGYDYLIQQRAWLLPRLVNDQIARRRLVRRPWSRLLQNLHWPRLRRRP